MHHYRIHTIETAPDKSRPALQGLQQAMGIIPNLAATMAESPTLLNGFVGAFGNFQGGSFDGAQRQVLLLTNAVTNGSAWAVAFHSTLALKEGVSGADVAAIRSGRLPDDEGHAALSAFTRVLIEARGRAGAAEIAAFRAAGFGADQVLEVIAGIAVSAMANYAGNITDPALEPAFAAQGWVGHMGA